LAYLIGVYLSDGYIKFDPRMKRYAAFGLKAKDRDFVELAARCLQQVFGLEQQPKIWEVDGGSGPGPAFRVEVRHRDFAEWLRRQCHGKRKIPGWLKRACQECKRALVAGNMDGNGCISMHSSVSRKMTRAGGGYPQIQYQLCIGVNDEKRLDVFVNFLRSMGVKMLRREHRMAGWNKQVMHYQYIQLDSFIQAGFCFGMSRKQERLEAFASTPSIRNPQRPYAVHRLSLVGDEMVHP